MLRPQDYPLPAAYQTAWDDTDTLYLEISPEVLADPNAIAPFVDLLMNPEGQTLNQRLDAIATRAEIREIQRRVRALGLDLANAEVARLRMAVFQSPPMEGTSISPATMSTMPSRMSSLLATCLYRDMASTPSSRPSLRIDSDAMPISSASVTAACNTRSLLRAGRGFARGSVLFAIGTCFRPEEKQTPSTLMAYGVSLQCKPHLAQP